MLDFLKEIDTHFSENHTTKELVKIGVPNAFARLHMSQLFKEYMTRYNKIQIKTVSDSSDTIMHKLMDGKYRYWNYLRRFSIHGRKDTAV